MEKLKMQTKDKTDKNIEAIAKLFPSVLTESIKGYDALGKPIIGKSIDFDKLRQELSDEIVEGNEERYQMNWPDKKKSILLANTPIDKTLRPCREESVDFDTTENLYIEGDNLDVLKLLQETYLGKVKMIYIDPPYNTGNDSFVYDDDFGMNQKDFSDANGQYDEDGNMMFDIRQNSESNGRYHTDWLNMIYPRLKLAKDLLTKEGVVFISIDDNEVDNLKKVANEIFGEDNFIACLIWERAFAPKNDAKYISNSHDYILVYSKSINDFKIGKLERTAEANDRYKNLDHDPRGVWASDNLTVKTYSTAYDYEILTPSGREVRPTDGRCWSTNKERMKELVKDNRIWFGGDGNNMPRLKRFLSEVQDGMVPISIWYNKEVGHNQEGRQELKKLFNDKGYFDGPKPIRLLSKIITIANLRDNSIVLDFFSGSATTAHAILQYNAQKNVKCKFIMVQLPEVLDTKSEAYKAGYKNICEIGKERIRRAGKKIKEENPEKEADLDTGFRVLKLDSTNMKDVYYNPNQYSQMALDTLEENIKEDRTPEDLLFQVMLELGELLSSDIEEMVIAGKKVFNVGGGNIIACFDKNITEEVVIEIARLKPYYAVFRDSSIANDSVATNFEQLFETYSPSTVRKVL